MQVDVSGIHLTITEELDGFVRKKAQKISRYLREPATCHVVLKTEKERYEAEVGIVLKGTVINGKDSGNDLYTCIEKALKKVIHQLKKYKDKKRIFRKSRLKTSSQSTIEPAQEETSILLQTSRTIAKPMEVEDAALQLKSSRSSFLIFLNAETNQINAIYRKGNSGLVLVEPS